MAFKPLYITMYLRLEVPKLIRAQRSLGSSGRKPRRPRTKSKLILAIYWPTPYPVKPEPELGSLRTVAEEGVKKSRRS